jgi:hypothetical protein
MPRRPIALGPPEALFFETSARNHVVKAGYDMRWVTAIPKMSNPHEGK